MWTEPVLLALFTALGAVLVKVVEHTTGSGARRQDELAKVRQDLMDEVATLRREQEALRREVDTWQAKYYDLRIELEVQRRENDLLQQELSRMRRLLSDAGPHEGPAAVPGGAP